MPDINPEPPLYPRDGSFVTGILQAIEPGDESEIIAQMEDIRVSLPPEMEGRLRALVGKHIIVAQSEGKWRAAEWMGRR